MLENQTFDPPLHRICLGREFFYDNTVVSFARMQKFRELAFTEFHPVRLCFMDFYKTREESFLLTLIERDICAMCGSQIPSYVQPASAAPDLIPHFRSGLWDLLFSACGADLGLCYFDPKDVNKIIRALQILFQRANTDAFFTYNMETFTLLLD